MAMYERVQLQYTYYSEGFTMCTIMAYCGMDGMEKVTEGLKATVSRGPDDQRIQEVAGGVLGFQRLSIMGLTPEGMQPFELDGSSVVCNGEIYGFRKLRDELIAKGYSFKSDSDCEILLPLYKDYTLSLFLFCQQLQLYTKQRQLYNLRFLQN